MPRQPIHVDNRPREEIARLVRDEMRCMPSYEMYINAWGIGAAEKWLALLTWDQNPDVTWTSHEGWYLYGNAESERFIKRRRPRASAAVLAFSLREYEATKARYHATDRYKAISEDNWGEIHDRDVLRL